MCGGRGPWSPFALVSAQPILVVVLVIDGVACVVGDDDAHASMCVDDRGGRCRSSVVVVGSTLAFANAHRSWVLMAGGCRLCGRSGPFWVVMGSRRLWEAGVSICRGG